LPSLGCAPDPEPPDLLDPRLFVLLDPRRVFERCCAIWCSFPY
jgi:hypothetical protein